MLAKAAALGVRLQPRELPAWRSCSGRSAQMWALLERLDSCNSAKKKLSDLVVHLLHFLLDRPSDLGSFGFVNPH